MGFRQRQNGDSYPICPSLDVKMNCHWTTIERVLKGFSLSRYSISTGVEFCLPIGAISGHFQLQSGPGKPKLGEKLGIPETIVLVFPELVPKRVPEPENGA
jgi:hypothetical protein